MLGARVAGCDVSEASDVLIKGDVACVSLLIFQVLRYVVTVLFDVGKCVFEVVKCSLFLLCCDFCLICECDT